MDMKMGSHIYLQPWEGEHCVMQAHSEVALTNRVNIQGM